MSKKYFALLLMAVMMLFAVSAVAAEDPLEGLTLCEDPTHSASELGTDILKRTEATCTDDAFDYVKCTGCVNTSGKTTGYKLVFVSPALSHAEVWKEEEPATCQAIGHKAGAWCTRCNTYVYGGTEISVNPDNHVFDKDVKEQLPTCEVPGWTAHKECSCRPGVKNDQYQPLVLKTTKCIFGKPIAAEVPATCQDGTTAKYGCINEGCNATIGGTKIEATEKSAAEFHATASDSVTIFEDKPMTCIGNGMKAGFYCAECKTQVGGEIKADPKAYHAGHAHMEYTKKVPATCKVGTEEGWSCADCGSKDGFAEIPAIVDFHKVKANLIREEAVAPKDCQTPGTGVGYYCEHCGNYKTGYKTISPDTIAAEFHANLVATNGLKKTDRVEPKCEEAGTEAKYECPVAGCDYYIGGETIDATGHKWDGHVQAKEPTCGEEGWDAYDLCTVCWTPSEHKTYEATGKHVYENGVCTVCGVPGEDHHHEYEREDNWTEGMGCSDPVIATYTCACGDSYTQAEGFYHDWRKGAVVIPGSCKVEQQIRYTCNVCGESELRPSGFVHNFVVKTVLGDCYNETWVGGVCTKCGEKDYNNGMWTERVHAWNVIINKPATCTEKGQIYKVCPKCDAEEYDEPEMIDHNMVETTEIVPATCEEDGGVLVKCSMCGKTEVKVLKDANGKPLYPANGKKHDFGVYDGENNTEWKKVNATCKAAGYWLKTCKKCGKTEIDTRDIDQEFRADCSATLVRVLTAATCTTDGVGKYECRWCGGDMGYGTISKDTAHTYKTTYIKEATCGVAGEEHLACTKCGATTVKTLNKIPYHVYEKKIVRGECMQPMQEGYICTVCGEKYGMQDIAGAITQHEIVLDTNNKAYVPAEPCSEKAGMDVYVCKYCKLAPEFVVTYGDHNWEVTDIVVKPSCGQDGGYKQICKDCKKEGIFVAKKEDGTPLYPTNKQHTFVDVPGASTVSTCHDIGYTLQQCTNCGKTEKVYDENGVDPTNHVLVVTRTLKEADCKNDGVVAKSCKYGCSGTQTYEIVKKAHAWVVKDSKEPTCEEGYKDKYCSKCDAVEFETIPAVRAHKYVKAMKPATCKEESAYGSFCEFCWAKGDSDDKYQVVAGSRLPHTETKVVVIEEPSCEKEGKYSFECSVCGVKDTKTIDSLGKHAWVKGEYVKADCETAGGYKYTCTKCKAEYVDEIGEPALGHQLITEADGSVKWFTQKGNCTDVDYEYTKCNRCQKVVDKHEFGYTSEPNKHDLKLTKTLKKASCTEVGVGIYTCADCENEFYKVIPAAHAWDKGTTLEAGNCGKGAKVEYKCTVEGCGATKTETAKPTGAHVWVYDLTNDTKDVVYKQCSVCGNRVVTEDLRANKDDQTACALYGHTVVTVDAKAPTCTEKGLTAGTKCSVCNKVLKAQEEVAATGHSFEEGKCTVCGAADPDCVACEHEFGAPVYGFNADLTMVVAKYTCTKCGEVKVEDVRPVK